MSLRVLVWKQWRAVFEKVAEGVERVDVDVDVGSISGEGGSLWLGGCRGRGRGG